ncbi:MAG: hypothetical protein A3F54_02945 [Candidatus Kerfeldbacteria bacterium RIFCSPHIGHO2_12_FULL_48_17]|uniref:Gcp-like domain-containing protein n=1 Tax=Candidatus Kerfeldbacteria bacterium RIFCSPHIGHO2_12_FULL_48_17 TaxID=1798542 RepID=A0A1G2B833_9BACT|nr:MAG: hypothetical protein A3F54_02945 [Candidatus Kerfeldbacteria bacterium RIFCSPHIGHO2_12_FULL_48_17]
MLLIVQTAVPNRIQLALGEKSISATLDEEVGFHQSEVLLKLTEKFLRQARCTWQDVRGIIVALGPGGSFTALRLGVVMANTLAWSLKIPNVGVTGEKKTLQQLWEAGRKHLEASSRPVILQPHYGQPPSITKPKKK